MTVTREDAGAAPSGAIPPGDRSVVTGIRGLRWWATLLIALVLTMVGVAADLLRSGSLGLLFMIFFPVGCVLAIVWARRSEMFGPMVQPPLLLVVTVPLSVLVTGSLPRAGGVVSTLIAVAGPLINGFPTMAITTAVCLAIGFVRSRLQILPTADDPDGDGRDGNWPSPRRPAGNRGDTDRDGGRDGAERGGADRDGGRNDGGRPAPNRPAAGGGPAGGSRPPGSGGERGRPRDDRPRDEKAPGVYRVSSSGETERVDRQRRPKPPR